MWAHSCLLLFYVCLCISQCISLCRVFQRFLLKIGDRITEMAGCLHRCVATFTCQLLVEVVSSLMTHGADSDGSSCLLSLPCCFCVLYSLSQPSLKQLQLSTNMNRARRHKSQQANAIPCSAAFCRCSATESLSVSLTFI